MVRKDKVTIFAVVALGLLSASCKPHVYASDNINSGPPPRNMRGDAVATKVTFSSDVEGDCYKAGLRFVLGANPNACSVIGSGRKELIVSNPCKDRGKYAATLCHEMGHLNGWSADHSR